MIWTVLTGDIVESSELAPGDLDAVMARLSALSQQIGQWPGLGRVHFSRRAGDGWQMALGAPGPGLRAALFLTAGLRAADHEAASRIAVAEGAGSIPESGDLNAAHGAVFTASGRLLDEMPRRSRLLCAGTGPLRAAFFLADHIAQGWTEAQARALVQMLPPQAGPRRLVAEHLGISRQAVDQALSAAGFAMMEEALAALEAEESKS